MASEEDIKQRIAEVQAKIDVPSYQDVAWDGAWKRRAGGMWGMMAVALVIGAAIGAAAPLFPILGGMEAAAAFALIPKSVAIFSAIGVSSGLVIGATMGPAAGAAASTMKEYERRQLARQVEELVRSNPDMPVELVEQAVLKKEEDKAKNARLSDYVSVSKGLLFAAFGALGGLVFAGALYATGGPAGEMVQQFAMPAMKTLLGDAAANAAIVTAYSAGLGACFGANFGVQHARITNHAVNFMNDLLSGKSLGSMWPERVNVPEQKPVLAPVANKPEPEMVLETKPNFAAKIDRKPNYEALVAQSIKEADSCCEIRR